MTQWNTDSAYSSTMEALRRAEQSLPDLSTSYDGEIRSLYEKIVNRPAFSYDASDDPLYGAYRERYVREGSLAMRDTIGRSAALTGGYGSSYAQSVGQQQYGEYLRKLGDLMPELYEAAYKRWQAEGEALNTRLSQASTLARDEYGRSKDRLNMATQLEKNAYESLRELISKAGYVPEDGELADAGMSRKAADALLAEYRRTHTAVSYGGGGYGGARSSTKSSATKAADSDSKEAVKLSEGVNSEKGRRK